VIRHVIDLLLGAILICGMAFLFGASPVRATECGLASWYGPGFHGKKTASGARFNENAMTAAHKTLPMGTRLRVTEQRTGHSIKVTINDRGPFIRGRIIDLSKTAAAKLGTKTDGVRKVCIERI
jgi:rare lipoprotein A